MNLFSSCRIAFCCNPAFLHCQFLFDALTQLQIEYGHSIDTLQSKQKGVKGFFEALSFGSSKKSDIVLLDPLERFANPLIILLLPYKLLIGSRVFAIYYSYSNLHALSFASIFYWILLKVSLIDGVFISDPLITRISKYYPENSLFFLPDSFSPREVYSKSLELISCFPSPMQSLLCSMAKAKGFSGKLSLLYDLSIFKASTVENPVYISVLGRLSEKKSINMLLKSISLYKSIFLTHNFRFVLAGPIDQRCESEYFNLIKSLISDGLLVYLPGKLSKRALYLILSLSNFSWCFQQNFYNSSGIFTRSLAWGSIPIVSSDSALAYISRRYNVGKVFECSEYVENARNLLNLKDIDPVNLGHMIDNGKQLSLGFELKNFTAALNHALSL